MYSCKETKKQKILEAAYLLFSENGYKQTKISDIAATAGIGKGTVYEYFDSKESLLIEIFSTGIEEYMAECEKIVQSEGTQTEKLMKLIKLESKYTEENGTRMMKLSMMILDTSDGLSVGFMKKMSDLWNDKYRFVYHILVQGMDKGEFRKINTEIAAISIMGTVGGYLNIKYGFSTLPDIILPLNVNNLEIQELIELILKGIQA
ncbi:TetR/AcrR family transcriptional regulator [Aminipila sp.]|uniref:TetR/AcrR family transcriptional regulator n=1 Tax=Aminipila sp. TaxID=2060095 RepID=UPI00289D9092|nr:TetR/AcrR family transcriptional regulator [Aminipila sp.]